MDGDLHLLPANLGDSACISEIVQAISAVRQFDGRSGMIRRPECRNWLHFSSTWGMRGLDMLGALGNVFASPKVSDFCISRGEGGGCCLPENHDWLF